MIKLFTALLLAMAIYATCTAQPNYTLSNPIDLRATGVNKVLCMKNGNTMLFHFELMKDIVVKVYDSTHKQIAGITQPTRMLDLYIIKDAVFKGLFEINGEAVLFIEQQHLGRYGLVRLRFNGTTGKLINETLVGESPTTTRRTRFYTMHNKDEDSYAVLFATDVPQFFDCRIYVGYYNSKHEVTKEVPIEVDRKKYDYLHVVNASSMPNGICISMSLAKLKQNGTVANLADAFGSPDIYDHQFFVYYIAKDSAKAKMASINVSTDIYPYYANYSYNEFANSINLLLFSYKEVAYRFGVQWLPAALMDHVFLKMDEQNMALSYKWMHNKLATKLVQEKTDTGKYYEGIPLQMTTNNNGLTTVISSSYSRYSEPQSAVRIYNYTYLGNIAVTQLDDDGNELWATVLPFHQRYMSYQRYEHPYLLANKQQTSSMFVDFPPQVTDRQLFGLNSYTHGRNTYMVFNGYDNDFNSPAINKAKDTVYNFSTTNACYYRLSSKKEATRQYLFGIPGKDQYNASFVEGADFDEHRGIYASLVMCHKGENESLRMGWSKLD